MGFQDVIIVSLTSVGVGLITIFMLIRAKTKDTQKAPDIDEETRFLFEDSILLNATESAEVLLAQSDRANSDWKQLALTLQTRFPNFPSEPPDKDPHRLILDSVDLGRQSQIAIEPVRGLIRVTLREIRQTQVESAADLHIRRVWASRAGTLRDAVQNSPYPIWQSQPSGQITWVNAAYELLINACVGPDADDFPALFDQEPNAGETLPRRRISLTLRDGSEQLWYDVSTVNMGATKMHYATDINAVVQAEIAQKSFVQTLTKTFAHLSTGLAIFDRKRELALFNPALTDLIEMPVEFLSNRPNLHSFFGRLRDAQMMPEPKNYRSWRDHLSELVDAAHTGSYLETWNLPSGLTYRVSGRPHPDGAVAFLFEDISAGVSLTRRFRSDLELNQSVLNHLSNAVVVFSANGMLNFCNQAYRKLWGKDADADFVETTLLDARWRWHSHSKPSEHWDDILRIASGTTEALECADVITLLDGRDLTVRANRLPSGALMVCFVDRHHTNALAQIVQVV